MKTSVILLATVLSLFVQVSSAANPDRNCSKNETTGQCLTWLAPSAPLVATFEEFTAGESTLPNFASLQPKAPGVADFSDSVADLNLEPVLPMTADFTDSTEELPAGITSLAPQSPSEADFE